MTVALLVGATGAKAGAEPTPPRLVVGDVVLERENIFARSEVDSATGMGGFLKRLSNRLHATTRPHVLRHEFLFREGDPFRADLLDETERNLRALGILAEVVVAPIDTTADGRVAVRVATRESWTLETDVTFSLDAGGQSRWTVQMADKNFMGYGVTAGAGLGRDLASEYWNLWYRQRRVAGSGLTLGLDYAKRSEGHLRQLELSRPFYALDDAVGMEGRAWSSSWRNRYYLSNGGPAGGADPAREASLYAEIPYEDIGTQFGAQHRLSGEGRGRIWRLGVGARVQERRFNLDDESRFLSDGRDVALDWLLEPGRPFAREQGTTVFPYLWLRTMSRRWVKEHHLLQYGGLEDVQLGWDMDLKVGPAGGFMGSSTADGRQRWRFETVLQRWMQLGPGYGLVLGVAEGDLGSAAVRNHRWNLVAGWMTRSGRDTSPWLTRVFVEAGAGENLTGARPFLLGAERGLRTLAVDGMAGDRLVRGNVELGRATGLQPFGVFRLGLAAFCNAGSAWWADEARSAGDLRREAGFGLRFGPVRSASVETARLDIAWSLDGGGPQIAAVTGGLF
ncbi:MAG: hypothetical protein IPI48_09780 [bacterium]|nr:hypothetical protein [bacterium]